MKRFKPLVDKLYFTIIAIAAVAIAIPTAMGFFYPEALFVTIPADLIVIYFVVSPLFGYVELGEDSLFIRYGLILKKAIPYTKIKGAVKTRKLYADSMVSLKCAIEHVNVKYGAFEVACVSVVDNDGFIAELESRIKGA